MPRGPRSEEGMLPFRGEGFRTEVSPGKSMASIGHFFPSGGGGEADGPVGQALRDRFGSCQFVGEGQEINSIWKAGRE